MLERVLRHERVGQHLTTPWRVVLAGPPLAAGDYAALAAAGATWYEEGFLIDDGVEQVRAHIRRGPPRV